MQTSVKPEAIACSGGCGLMIQPEYAEPVELLGRKFLGGWGFAFRTCEKCEERINAESMKKRQEAQRRRRLTELTDLLGGVKAAEEFTFEAYRKTPDTLAALQACRAFDPAHTNLYVWGPCGTGKTHVASAVAREAYLAGRSVRFFKPGPLMRSIRMKSGEEQEGLIRSYASAEVFVLDDLGIGQATEFYSSVLYEILDMRDMNRRNGLLVTSNLSLGDLAAKLGDDRITSRIAGMCQVLKMAGADHRMGKRENM